MSQRIKYRTSDGLYHLWTQEEIDNYIEQELYAETPVLHEVSTGPHDEALPTMQMSA